MGRRYRIHDRSHPKDRVDTVITHEWRIDPIAAGWGERLAEVTKRVRMPGTNRARGGQPVQCFTCRANRYCYGSRVDGMPGSSRAKRKHNGKPLVGGLIYFENHFPGLPALNVPESENAHRTQGRRFLITPERCHFVVCYDIKITLKERL